MFAHLQAVLPTVRAAGAFAQMGFLVRFQLFERNKREELWLMFKCPLPEGGKRGEAPALMLTLHPSWLPPFQCKAGVPGQFVLSTEDVNDFVFLCCFRGLQAEQKSLSGYQHCMSPAPSLCSWTAYVRIKKLNALLSFIAVNKEERPMCPLGCVLAEDQGL